MSTETLSEDFHWKGLQRLCRRLRSAAQLSGDAATGPWRAGAVCCPCPGTEEGSCSLLTLFRTGFGFAIPRGEAKSQMWQRTFFCPDSGGRSGRWALCWCRDELPAPVPPARCPAALLQSSGCAVGLRGRQRGSVRAFPRELTANAVSPVSPARGAEPGGSLAVAEGIVSRWHSVRSLQLSSE